MMIEIARGVAVNPELVSAIKDADSIREPLTIITLIDGQCLTVQTSYAVVMETLND